jgi:hypothetical protein
LFRNKHHGSKKEGSKEKDSKEVEAPLVLPGSLFRQSLPRGGIVFYYRALVFFEVG